jgi:hypothetical protein
MTITRRITDTDRCVLEKRLLYEAFSVCMWALRDEVGSAMAAELTRSYLRNSGAAFVANMTDMFGIEGDEFERIADITSLAEELYDWKGPEVSKEQGRIVRIGNPNCPLKYGPSEICVMGHEIFITTICETINPEYHCKLLQLASKGDPYCSLVIEKK